MVIKEIENTCSTVRIHDEFCEGLSPERISYLSKIVSDSYKRRMLNDNKDINTNK